MGRSQPSSFPGLADRGTLLMCAPKSTLGKGPGRLMAAGYTGVSACASGYTL